MSQFDLDEAQTLARIIDSAWGLDKDKPPIEYLPERFLVNARNGLIFVSTISNTTKIDAVDYQSLTQDARVAVRISARYREDLYRWREEVRRILYEFRRPGRMKGIIGSNTYLEVTATRNDTDLSGWYATIFDVRLIGYCIPIESSGTIDPSTPTPVPNVRHADSFEWAGNVNYKKGSLCTKDGSLYLAMDANSGKEPPAEPWKLISADAAQEKITLFKVTLPAGEWKDGKYTAFHVGFKGGDEYKTEVYWSEDNFEDCISSGILLDSVTKNRGVFSQTKPLLNSVTLDVEVYKTMQVTE